jgi:hypothetical protein
LTGSTNVPNYSTYLGYIPSVNTGNTGSVALGYQAGLAALQPGTVAIGYQAGYIGLQQIIPFGNTGCSIGNIAIGYQAGYTGQGITGTQINPVPTTSSTIAIGYQAGYSNQQISSIAIGYNAGLNNLYAGNIAIGHQAGLTGQGVACVAIGYQAGINSPLTSINSTIIGYQAGTVSGSNNVIIGFRSANGTNSTGGGVTLVGYQAGGNTPGANSTSIGSLAGSSLSQASSVNIGSFAGQYYAGTGSVNIGYQAGVTGQSPYSVVIGTPNTNISPNVYRNIVGTGPATSGLGVTGMNNSIIIGYGGVTGSVGSILYNSIVINATPSQIRLDNTGVSGTTGTAGPVGPGCYMNPLRASTSTPNVMYYNSVTNEITYTTSSGLDKTDVKDLVNDTSTLYNLKPRNYTYIPDGTTECVGFIAEEVNAVDASLTMKDIYGKPQNINWDAMSTYMLTQIQKLNQRIQVLEDIIISNGFTGSNNIVIQSHREPTLTTTTDANIDTNNNTDINIEP